MPLIRYCTGDLAQVVGADDLWRLGRVVGRVHDVVTISGVAYATHHIQDVLDHRIGDIDEFQIDVRTSPPTLRLVPRAGIDRENLARKINAYWPTGFSLAFVGADELIRVGHRAKFRHVVS
jgi:phenylacetate-CoA ligase